MPCLIYVPQSVLTGLLKLVGKSHWNERLLGNLQVDISKAKRLLGWQPVFNVEEGIQHVITKNV